MPLDAFEADHIGFARNGVGSAAPRCVDAQGLTFDLIAKVMQRDDPLRRSYLQRRWRSQAVERCNIDRTPYSSVALRR
jgi:hypothetical protein